VDDAVMGMAGASPFGSGIGRMPLPPSTFARGFGAQAGTRQPSFCRTSTGFFLGVSESLKRQRRGSSLAQGTALGIQGNLTTALKGRPNRATIPRVRVEYDERHVRDE
jgi:hypothetical protein